MPVQILKRLFTVEEYHRMAQAKILGEDDRVELIEGEIINMTPIGSRHAGTVNRINHLFSRHLVILQTHSRRDISGSNYFYYN